MDNKKKKISLKDKKVSYRKYLVAIFSLLTILIGLSFNFDAVKENGGKMPVLIKKGCDWDTDTHFSFNDFSQVQEPLKTDIIRIGNHMVSIGDILQLLGIIVLFGLLSHDIIVAWKWDKK